MESPETLTFSDDFDSACSTPFVSAPSSPGRTSYANAAAGTGGYGGGFFYSAPASPIHFMISSSSSSSKKSSVTSPEPSGPFQFGTESESMTSADELFLNGQIRPLQVLSPLLDNENENENDDDVTSDVIRGREVLGSNNRSKSLRRRARSMSPLRNTSNAFDWLPDDINEFKPEENNKNNDNDNGNGNDNDNDKDKLAEMETTPSGASSRSSSVGRSSKRWVFLKEFLYRSKSEGRTSTTSNSHGNTNNIKFWTSLSFSPNKDKKLSDENLPGVKGKGKVTGDGNVTAKKAVNGVSNRRVGGRSAHEVHYTVNRAQAEEMRRKTYLPYKQGLLGCLGFSSKSYGAMNGFARALNPVSSR